MVSKLVYAQLKIYRDHSYNNKWVTGVVEQILEDMIFVKIPQGNN